MTNNDTQHIEPMDYRELLPAIARIAHTLNCTDADAEFRQGWMKKGDYADAKGMNMLGWPSSLYRLLENLAGVRFALHFLDTGELDFDTATRTQDNPARFGDVLGFGPEERICPDSEDMSTERTIIDAKSGCVVGRLVFDDGGPEYGEASHFDISFHACAATGGDLWQHFVPDAHMSAAEAEVLAVSLAGQSYRRLRARLAQGGN